MHNVKPVKGNQIFQFVHRGAQQGIPMPLDRPNIDPNTARLKELLDQLNILVDICSGINEKTSHDCTKAP
jgi:hypothetical protein